MTGFPNDIAALLNGDDALPVEPSAEAAEAHSKRLTVEDIERLREETAAELNPEDSPHTDQRPLDTVELFNRGLL